MKEVSCWCCEYFVLTHDYSKTEDINGLCKRKNKHYCMHSTVCEFFILKKGLHTQKIIPDYVLK